MNRFTCAVALLFLLLLPHAANAQEQHAAERLYAWRVGTLLSQAAWWHYKGIEGEKVEETLGACRELATKGLKVEIPAFPAKTGDATKDETLAMDYISSEGGRPIGIALAERYDMKMASLFELAMKARLAVILYRAEPGDDLNESLVKALTRCGTDSGLPEELWKPLVEKIKNLAPHEQVAEAVATLDTNVTKHLHEQTQK